jgi:hypothetical protein
MSFGFSVEFDSRSFTTRGDMPRLNVAIGTDRWRRGIGITLRLFPFDFAWCGRWVNKRRHADASKENGMSVERLAAISAALDNVSQVGETATLQRILAIVRPGAVYGAQAKTVELDPDMLETTDAEGNVTIKSVRPEGSP